MAHYLARIADARVAITIRARMQAVTAQCSSAIANAGTLYTNAVIALTAIRHAVIAYVLLTLGAAKQLILVIPAIATRGPTPIIHGDERSVLVVVAKHCKDQLKKVADPALLQRGTNSCIPVSLTHIPVPHMRMSH